MGGKIPNKIRKLVIMEWLNGASRDQIAKDNQIGAGTVSAIIKQCKLEEQQKREYAADDDFEFDLIRELVEFNNIISNAMHLTLTLLQIVLYNTSP